MDDNPLSKWQLLQHCISIMPKVSFFSFFLLQEVTNNNVRLTFIVGDTTQAVQSVLSMTNSIDTLVDTCWGIRNNLLGDDLPHRKLEACNGNPHA